MSATGPGICTRLALGVPPPQVCSSHYTLLIRDSPQEDGAPSPRGPHLVFVLLQPLAQCCQHHLSRGLTGVAWGGGQAAVSGSALPTPPLPPRLFWTPLTEHARGDAGERLDGAGQRRGRQGPTARPAPLPSLPGPRSPPSAAGAPAAAPGCSGSSCGARPPGRRWAGPARWAPRCG